MNVCMKITRNTCYNKRNQRYSNKDFKALKIWTQNIFMGFKEKLHRNWGNYTAYGWSLANFPSATGSFFDYIIPYLFQTTSTKIKCEVFVITFVFNLF